MYNLQFEVPQGRPQALCPMELVLLGCVLDGRARAEEVRVTVRCQILACKIMILCQSWGSSPSSARATVGQNFFSMRYGSG